MKIHFWRIYRLILIKFCKKLYEDNNISSGYTFYTNGFGYEGPVLVFISWAKSPADHAAKIEKRNEVLGSKGQELWERTESHAYRIENKSGCDW